MNHTDIYKNEAASFSLCADSDAGAESTPIIPAVSFPPCLTLTPIHDARWMVETPQKFF